VATIGLTLANQVFIAGILLAGITPIVIRRLTKSLIDISAANTLLVIKEELNKKVRRISI